MWRILIQLALNQVSIKIYPVPSNFLIRWCALLLHAFIYLREQCSPHFSPKGGTSTPQCCNIFWVLELIKRRLWRLHCGWMSCVNAWCFKTHEGDLYFCISILFIVGIASNLVREFIFQKGNCFLFDDSMKYFEYFASLVWMLVFRSLLYCLYQCYLILLCNFLCEISFACYRSLRRRHTC